MYGKIDMYKNAICETIDSYRNDIVNIGEDIYRHPELGYREFRTSSNIKSFFENELDFIVEDNLAITGIRAFSKNKKKGPTIAILGELDGIPCSGHKDSLANGESHTCGHNIQVAGMIGAAIGLVKSGVLDHLDGNIEFIATPAEEFIDIEYKKHLRKLKKIRYFGGKQELIRLGIFDNVDISIMFHVLDLNGKKVMMTPKSNGFIGKSIEFIGIESHAGSAPEKGVNALTAANLALNNINAQRDTFKDEDRVRIHPIITRGGETVNIVPSNVKMESYTRSRTIEGMLDANNKVNRAIMAGAMAVGGKVVIEDIPGYLPITIYDELENISYKSLKYLGIEDSEIIYNGDFTGSFDMGDVSHIMPTLHPMFGGIDGELHSNNYKIVDKDYIYTYPSKYLALICVELLSNKANIARNIITNSRPKMTKKEYLSFMESSNKILNRSYIENI